MIEIYVVIGSTGQYDDRYEWVARAFTSQEAAQDFVNEASAIARREFQRAKESPLGFWSYVRKHELDPNFSLDYTGTSYDYKEVILEGLPYYG